MADVVIWSAFRKGAGCAELTILLLSCLRLKVNGAEKILKLK